MPPGSSSCLDQRPCNYHWFLPFITSHVQFLTNLLPLYSKHSESVIFLELPLLLLWLSLLSSLPWVAVVSSYTVSLFADFIQLAQEQSFLYRWARVILLKCTSDHVTPPLKTLQWLPYQCKIPHDLSSSSSHVIPLFTQARTHLLPCQALRSLNA